MAKRSDYPPTFSLQDLLARGILASWLRPKRPQDLPAGKKLAPKLTFELRTTRLCGDLAPGQFDISGDDGAQPELIIRNEGTARALKIKIFGRLQSVGPEDRRTPRVLVGPYSAPQAIKPKRPRKLHAALDGNDRGGDISTHETADGFEIDIPPISPGKARPLRLPLRFARQWLLGGMLGDGAAVDMQIVIAYANAHGRWSYLITRRRLFPDGEKSEQAHKLKVRFPVGRAPKPKGGSRARKRAEARARRAQQAFIARVKRQVTQPAIFARLASLGGANRVRGI